MKGHALWSGFLLLFAAFFAVPRAEGGAQLAELSIEELLEVEVRSVSRRSEKWTESAAAIFVITGEEIRRSGVLTLPEALRLVPGLHAAQINASQWAISARGFNGQFANKTLVLIDGRSLYSQLTGGIVWEFQDLPLELIERIEVVRGPGATLWGAGAVNGVINIITREAADTLGGLLALGAGESLDSAFQLRWGGQKGKTAYRLWAKHLDFLASQNPEGAAKDDWLAERGGLRLDHDTSFGRFSFDMTAAEGHVDGLVDEFEPVAPFLIGRDRRVRFHQKTGSLRFNRQHGPSAWHVQVNAEHVHQRSGRFEEERLNTELDLQHQWSRGRHELVWGLDYRRSSDEFTNTFDTRFPADTEPFEIWSIFAQDQLTLSPKLRLIGGLKLEQRNSGSLETQPSLRLAYSPAAGRTFWLAASKAARFPTRSELDIQRIVTSIPLPTGAPIFVVVEGSPDLGTEEMTAFEAGYRQQLSPQLFFDLAAFDFHYEHLLVLHPGSLGVDSSFGLTLPLAIENGAEGRAYGFEGNLIWQPSERFRVDLGVSTLRMEVEVDRPEDLITESPGSNPELQAFTRLSFNDRSWHAELAFRWVDEMSALEIPSATSLDASVGIELPKNLRLQLSGRNLTDKTHEEYRGNSLVLTHQNSVTRNLLGLLEWRF